MTTEEFNNKWIMYIELGFESQGMMINDPKVISYLDTEFEKLKNDGIDFLFSQIKMKFNSPCIYVDHVDKDLLKQWYEEIHKLLNNDRD